MVLLIFYLLLTILETKFHTDLAEHVLKKSLNLLKFLLAVKQREDKYFYMTLMYNDNRFILVSHRISDPLKAPNSSQNLSQSMHFFIQTIIN